MECKECKVVCDGTEVATIDCEADRLTIQFTEEGKEMHKHMKGKGCCH